MAVTKIRKISSWTLLVISSIIVLLFWVCFMQVESLTLPLK